MQTAAEVFSPTNLPKCDFWQYLQAFLTNFSKIEIPGVFLGAFFGGLFLTNNSLTFNQVLCGVEPLTCLMMLCGSRCFRPLVAGFQP